MNAENEHVVLMKNPDNFSKLKPTLTRVHSECFTGDVLGSCKCDCRLQLYSSMRQICAAGCGILIRLGGHEGRGIGLAAKVLPLFIPL